MSKENESTLARAQNEIASTPEGIELREWQILRMFILGVILRLTSTVPRKWAIVIASHTAAVAGFDWASEWITNLRLSPDPHAVVESLIEELAADYCVRVIVLHETHPLPFVGGLSIDGVDADGNPTRQGEPVPPSDIDGLNDKRAAYLQAIHESGILAGV